MQALADYLQGLLREGLRTGDADLELGRGVTPSATLSVFSVNRQHPGSQLVSLTAQEVGNPVTLMHSLCTCASTL